MWTWLAYLSVTVCVLIILVEFLWLYILSARSESKTAARREAEEEISSRIENIIHSPTQSSMDKEVSALKNYVKKDRVKMDILSDMLLDIFMKNDIMENEAKQKAIYLIYNAINPKEYYSALLRSGNTYDKAYACRKLSDFFAEDEVASIRSFAFSNNKDLAYNAAITLSMLGDEDSVAEVILSLQYNRRLSHRIIVEIIDKYSGDLTSLARKIMGKADEYILSSLIKALAKYKLEEFEDKYISYLREGSVNLKVAALRALGELGKTKYEHDFLVAVNSKNWIVRSAAVKAMKNIPTERILNAIMLATKDPEWWVRYNAAKSLVAVDKDFTYVEKILQGYDQFAAEAVKHALYQIYDKNSGDIAS
ncbi:MAG TPA: HEAT repeat domain-containing protein [Clostridia bacterium]|nr:HEAT repeat domain-containing protein [Clostridia bacterium]